MMVEFDQYKGRQKISASEFSEGTKYYANKLYPLVRDQIYYVIYDSLDEDETPKNVFDLGSGDGQLAQLLLKEDYVNNVVLVDTNDELLETARNNLLLDNYRESVDFAVYKEDFVKNKNYLRGIPRESIATLINVTGYYDTDTLSNIIANINSKYVIANFFVLEDNLDKEVIETNLFKSITKNRLDHGNEYIFEFDLGWADSTLNLKAMPKFEFERMVHMLKTKYDIDATVERYTDFKNERMVTFYKN